MKIRPIPAVLSLVITLLVLFGGWSLYEWFQVKQPIRSLLEQEQHITDYDIHATPKNVSVELQVKPNFTLTGDYLGLLARMKELSGRNNVTVTLKDDPDSSLLKKWNELYFIVAEGIERSEYQTMLTQLQQYPLGQNVQLQVAMDREHLYVWLQQSDEQTLFQALPLSNVETGTEVNADA